MILLLSIELEKVLRLLWEVNIIVVISNLEKNDLYQNYIIDVDTEGVVEDEVNLILKVVIYIIVIGREIEIVIKKN